MDQRMVINEITTNLTINKTQHSIRGKNFTENLSKKIANILRHTAKECGLAMDKEGFVNVDELLRYINSNSKWSDISINDINNVIQNIPKKRFELKESKIRAYYGHSFAEKVVKMESIPPHILYHGTSHEAVEQILKSGLCSQKRQYVHLSAETDTAISVGKRKDANPIILIVDTLSAIKDGIKFYFGNQTVWLSDNIPAKYLKVLK